MYLFICLEFSNKKKKISCLSNWIKTLCTIYFKVCGYCRYCILGSYDYTNTIPAPFFFTFIKVPVSCLHDRQSSGFFTAHLACFW